MDYYTKYSFGFGSGMTPLIKKFLIVYSAIYILELFLEHWLGIPLVRALQLYPHFEADFHLWQILTHPFIHDPLAPIPFLIDLLVFYFFAGPLKSVFGSKRFLTFFYFSALGAAVCGLAVSAVFGGKPGIPMMDVDYQFIDAAAGGMSIFNYPFMGMTPSILAMVVVFGLLNPEATILLFFILPIKAKFISYGTIVVVGLTFLAKVNPFGGYHLGGILFGYLFFKYLGNAFDPNLIYLKYLQWQHKRQMRKRFKVYDGRKGKDDDDKPTFH